MVKNRFALKWFLFIKYIIILWNINLWRRLIVRARIRVWAWAGVTGAWTRAWFGTRRKAFFSAFFFYLLTHFFVCFSTQFFFHFFRSRLPLEIIINDSVCTGACRGSDWMTCHKIVVRSYNHLFFGTHCKKRSLITTQK